MARWMAILAGLMLVIALTPITATADEPPGAKLFSTYCSACHGNGGKGGFALAIGSEAYLSQAKDDVIQQFTADGVPAKGMPAWSKAKGGMLTDQQIEDIVAYLRSLAAPASTTVVTAPTPSTSVVQVAAQTTMTLAQSATPEGQWVVNATLKEFNGSPVTGAVVTFSRETLFGVVNLGTAKTDIQGTARLVLNEVPGNSSITAGFKADKKYESAQAQIVLDPGVFTASAGNVSTRNVRLDIDEPLLEPEGSLVTPNPPLVPATLFLLVVAGIWSVYAYVISQIIGIWRDRPAPAGDNQLRMKPR